jgi:hypothetical protein
MLVRALPRSSTLSLGASSRQIDGNAGLAELNPVESCPALSLWSSFDIYLRDAVYDQLAHGAVDRSNCPGGNPATLPPFPFDFILLERSSSSMVRFAAQLRRALDRSGPFRTSHLDKGKEATTKPTVHSLPALHGGSI